MQRGQIDGVRRFNRAVAQRIGALDEAYLSRDRPLGLARLLWEIGAAGSEVRTLRSRFGLDSGHLSRQLRRLESDGLVTVDADRGDGRVRNVRLTQAGITERAILDSSSDDLATSILKPLTAHQRERLVAAMAEVERLLLAAQVQIAIAHPHDPAARSCLRAYYDELAQRFDAGFDPAQSISADDDEITLPRGLFLVASLHGSPVGCAALKLHPDDAVAEVKRMWTAVEVRGLGLGRRLLAQLEDEALRRGVRTLRLETNKALTEAVQLYRSAGFHAVPRFNQERYAHHWFEKTLENATDHAIQ